MSEELVALPSPIRDAHTQGVKANLTSSIGVIDRGLDVAIGASPQLIGLRLGALMIDAGYQVNDADPDRHYSGTLPWLGSLSQTERRIADLQRQRAEAEAQLADALLDDAERERRGAENEARIAAENARPVRKVRGDGSEYDRYPDGRIVEVTS